MFNYSIEVWGDERAIVVTTDTETTELLWDETQTDPVTGEAGTWVSADQDSRREVFLSDFPTAGAAEQICHDLRERIARREISSADQFWRIIALERAAILQPFDLADAFHALWEETENWD